MISSESYSLLQLNELIKTRLRLAFDLPVWLRAEISELHENANGHAYFELVEKDSSTDRLVAKTKATCWATTYRMLKPYFEVNTGESLRAGINILVACTVEYHELYGISLNIRDINPEFTIGDMARRRLEILRRLESDGVFDMNKSLTMPVLPQRIAVISSATAAGYGDFIHQLQNNADGFVFYTRLFPAVMQGEQAAGSIIAALDRIFQHQQHFDVVAIIRGGGATAELSCFDDYELAFNGTQFPLPVITGIGHERDQSVLDEVAHTRCKTPTAVAEFLIARMYDAMNNVLELQQSIVTATESLLQGENIHLEQIMMRLSRLTNELIVEHENRIALLLQRLKMQASAQTREQAIELKTYKQRLRTGTQLLFDRRNHQVSLLEKEVNLSSPAVLLQRGYSLTLHQGKIVRSTTQLHPGDHITTVFSDGETASVVE
ncbi:MAG: exodeoxyribonuclease VII large subunit [Prevotellaceae bacterium]|jgi:exodeoxyribonuclease VII large subunit|nr:exodeoxyribonuclease VII large subunit [Prevotellaceae bacterium]